jgi:ABC-2 type transport system permease protein
VTGRQILRALLAQTRLELSLTLRRGESVLVTVIIPAALMVFFASAAFLPLAGRKITFLLPGTLALAVISTGLVSLGIATAYERYYGVLKRLGITPLPSWALLAAKILAVLALEVLQIALLVGIALLFGWRLHGSPLLAAIALLLGTACFAGIGLAMAGGLRAEATLAGANGLFLFFLLLGGLYVPLNHLPGLLVPVAQVLPAAPLADVLRASMAHDAAIPFRSMLTLVLWAVAAPVFASLVFRWE